MVRRVFPESANSRAVAAVVERNGVQGVFVIDDGKVAVEVSAVDGMLAVTMKALAMENGAQGDTVTVRNPESRKDFAAMVIDENRVQVRF